MKTYHAVFGAILAVAATALPSVVSARSFLQCVPFARQVSGVDIRGNAKTWWAQAAGRYERGQQPREGAVLTLPGSGRMSNGHVATVSQVVGAREVLLTHANWSRRGEIERNVRAVDVSENGDWTRVKIWFERSADLGTTSYPAYGFIYNDKAVRVASAQAPARSRFTLSSDVIHLASLER